MEPSFVKMKSNTFEFSHLYSPGRAPDKLESQNNPNDPEGKNSRSGNAKKKKQTPLKASQSTGEPTAASTPVTTKSTKEYGPNASVHTILKSHGHDNSLDFFASEKPKKRNKSVSFALDDVEINPKKSKSSIETTQSSTEDTGDKKFNKKKKKKRSSKTDKDTNHEEQVPGKNRKNKNKTLAPTEDIKENLANLNLGDNPHTLADLLDEVKVVDKTKKRKPKKMSKTDAAESVSSQINEDAINVSENSEEIGATQKSKKKGKRAKFVKANEETEDGEEEVPEVKEKVKWVKRKWNRERRGAADSPDMLGTSVVVDDVPLSLLLSYKKLLTEHFSKCGVIKKIGVAEVYPTAEPRPVFTTTIQFHSEEGAQQALEEDNLSVGGARLRVRRPLPATATTVAVRCFAGCAPHLLTPVFATCGRVRSIREILKGKSSIPTAFVEFDGPEAVERALAVAGEVRIGGKKVLVNRYEDRGGQRQRTDSEVAAGSA